MPGEKGRSRLVRCGGMKGMSDLIGWRMITVTMIARDQSSWPGRYAVWVALEVKRPGQDATAEQQAFLDAGRPRPARRRARARAHRSDARRVERRCDAALSQRAHAADAFLRHAASGAASRVSRSSHAARGAVLALRRGLSAGPLPSPVLRPVPHAHAHA